MKSLIGIPASLSVLILLCLPVQARQFASFTPRLTAEERRTVASVLRDEVSEAYGTSAEPGYQVWRTSLGSDLRTTLFVWFQDSMACGASSLSTCPVYILANAKGRWRKVDDLPFYSRDLAVEMASVKGVRVLTNWSPEGGLRSCAHLRWTGGGFVEGRYRTWSYCKGGPR